MDPESLAAGVDVTDVAPLRRKLLRSHKTGGLYLGLITKFHKQFALTKTSCYTTLDRCLDVALNKMFVAGKHVSQCLHLFYAVRWFHNLLSSEMRYSTLSRRGFQKACPVRAPCPLTWEEVLVMSLALCQELCSIYSAKIRAAAALGFLLAFECYGRGGDVSAVEATELRPPIGRKS